MTPHPREEELRIRLRAAADEHRPDREAMLARIERRRGEGASGAVRAERARGRLSGGSRFGGPGFGGPGLGGSGFGGLRPAAAAAALAAVVVLGVGGTWLVVDSGRSTQTDAASVPAPPAVTGSAPAGAASPSTSSTTAPSPAAASPSESSTSPRPAKSRAPSRPPRTSQAPSTSLPIESIPDGNAPERGWLWSDGTVDPNSNANWAQSTVTLKNKTEITALDVTIRVAVTAGVRTTGKWSNIPNDKLVAGVREQSGWLYYRFRLRDGATIAPGSYTFAGQFNHSGNRDAGKDAYLASASAGTQDVEVHGGF